MEECCSLLWDHLEPFECDGLVQCTCTTVTGAFRLCLQPNNPQAQDPTTFYACMLLLIDELCYQQLAQHSQSTGRSAEQYEQH